MSFRQNLLQEATYWPPGTNDGFGSVEFGEPQILRVRWQNGQSLARDAQGREFLSEAVVYTDEAVQLRGFLSLGDHTYIGDPRDVEGAHEIRSVQQSPNLSNSVTLYKVLL
jgi:hypothetical protein